MANIEDSKSTGKTHCLLSEKQIDQWVASGKKKARAYDKNLSSSTIRKKTQNNSILNAESLEFHESLNQLRERSRSEKSHSSIISNRIKYLEVDRNRKSKMVEIAKTKYHRLIEVRHKSFVEKNQLNKERETFLKTQQKLLSSQVSKIKSERLNSTASLKNWKERNQSEANQIKSKKQYHQSIILHREKAELLKKKEMIQKVQLSATMGKEKIQDLRHSRAESAKKTHQLKLFEEFRNGQLQKRKNTKLLNNFKKQATALQSQNAKYAKQLDQYRQFLGLNNSFQQGMHKSFYITNY